MSSKLPYKQAANVERRTWDKETYEAKAKARQASENGAGDTNNNNMMRYQGNKRPLENNDDQHETSTSSETIPIPLREEEKEEFQTAEEGAACPWRSKRAFLKSRRGKVDLDSKVGRTEIINPDAAAASSTTDGECVSITDGVTKGVNGVGWHCKVCDCFLKDSLAYLDHINGRKHQRKLGYSMRVEKSTTNEVVSKLDQLARDQKAKMNEAAALSNNSKNGQGIGDDDEDFNPFDEMVRKKDQDAAQRKADRKRRRAERKKKARGEIVTTSNENAVLVGDSSNIVNEAEKVEEQVENEDDGGANPDLMAMMGFSGFS
eukprot:827_1